MLSFGLMCCNFINLGYQKLLTSLMEIMWENFISSSEISLSMHNKVIILHNICGH